MKSFCSGKKRLRDTEILLLLKSKYDNNTESENVKIEATQNDDR